MLDKLLYADMAENAKPETKMQRTRDRISQAYDNFDLTQSRQV